MIPVHNLDTQKLLNESETFCMMPWVHIHKTPEGITLPCCIGSFDYKDSIPKDQGVEGSINSEFMKQLRLDMLAGKRPGICETCHKSEAVGGDTAASSSYRKDSSRRYGKYIDEVLHNTGIDGHLHDFKMRYFDIRFSNICNFKCRSCNAGYSSLWEAEDLKWGVRGDRVPTNNVDSLVSEVIDHISFMDYAYFAGGEPLITDEHYTILQTMIDMGRTDIKLIYNSNASNLNFKNHNILEMWEKFDSHVEFYASIDHYGKRAEYIRHGTRWDTVEENLRILKQAPHVGYMITSTITNMNYLDLGDIVDYFMNNDIWPDAGSWQLNPVWNPKYFSPRALPPSIKQAAKQRLHQVLESLPDDFDNYPDSFRTHFSEFYQSVEHADTWEENSFYFQRETRRLDEVRAESFTQVFPELSELMDK